MLVPLFQYVYGEGVVPSEGPCFTTLSRCRCCARGVRSLATWRKEVYTDLAKKQEALCTRSACKRSLWCQFISCRVPPSKSDISRGVPCCVSSRLFQWQRAAQNSSSSTVVHRSVRSTTGGLYCAPQRDMDTRAMAGFREHHTMNQFMLPRERVPRSSMHRLPPILVSHFLESRVQKQGFNVLTSISILHVLESIICHAPC